VALAANVDQPAATPCRVPRRPRFGFALSLQNSSVWLYNSAGVADASRNSLASFYFGGFRQQ
jgi:hypothetical protein